MTTRKTLRIIAILLGVSFIGGCSVFKEEEKLACPRLQVLDNAQNFTKLVPGYKIPPALGDIIFNAKFSYLVGNCGISSKRMANFDIKYGVSALRGASLKGKKQNIPVVIALLDSQGNIVKKMRKEVSLDFEDQQATHEDEFEIETSIPKGQRLSSYRIIVGFDVSPQQYQFNKKYGQK